MLYLGAVPYEDPDQVTGCSRQEATFARGGLGTVAWI